jgi:chorismate mutase
MEKRLFALRGASCSINNEEDIKGQVVKLYDEILTKNGLAEDDIVSIIFSVTGDLNAKNPAQALRQAGRAEKTALFVTQEAFFQGQLERVIRILIHCYLETEPFHVYLNGAELLRPEYSLRS